jgi:4-hydroxy-tetrahydrodipicolinate reductase
MNAESSQDAAKIRVAVSGARGRMGSMTCEAIAADEELMLVAAIDPAFADSSGAQEGVGGAAEPVPRFTSLDAGLRGGGIDVVVEFSTPTTVRENVLNCVACRVPVVVGTTGLSAGDLAEIDRQASEKDVAVLIAPNFAMGAVLMMRFAEEAARHFGACEIVELHHEAKVDAPSGTARLTRLRIEEAWREGGLDRDVPVHSVRLPGLVAHQEVIFGGLGETLTVRHDSLSRESFMPGVLLAVKRVRGLQGLVVGLENIL